MKRLSLLLFLCCAVVFISSCKDKVETIKVVPVNVYRAEPIFVTEENLPPGINDIPYYLAINVVGGEPPYTFELTLDDLPDGMAFTSEGELVGTPTAADIRHYPVPVKVTDANGITAGKTFTFRITASVYECATKWGTDITTTFICPYKVAVDQDNNIFVADSRTRFIYKYNSAKELVLSFDGNLDYIEDMTILNNDLYVLIHSSIKQFTLDGSLIATTYLPFYSAEAFCFDADYAYVLTYDEEIVKLDQDCQEVDRFYLTDTYARDIGCDNSYLYVADVRNDSIWVLNPITGGIVDQWGGSPGSGPGEFDYPQTLAVDKNNSFVYVGDWNNHRVQKLTTAGAYVSEFGTFGNDDGEFYAIDSICLNATGDVAYVADSDSKKVQWFSTDTGTFIDKLSVDLSADDCLNMPSGIAVSNFNDVMVDQDPQTTDLLEEYNYKNYILTGGGDFRITAMEITETSATLMVNDDTFTLREGEFTFIKNHDREQTAALRVKEILYEEPGDVNNSMVEITLHLLVSYAGSDKVYVCDTENHCVKVYDLGGNFLFKFGSQGFGNGEFDSPYGVVVDNVFCRIMVVDAYNHRIQVFTQDGTFVTAFGGYGLGDGQFTFPTKCTVDPFGNLYVLEPSQPRIQVFNLEYEYVTSFGEDGDDPGQLEEAMALAFYNNSLFVCDEEYVSVFTPDGTFLRRWELDFWAAGGMVIDPHGDVYVSTYSAIFKYANDGTLIARFGSYGIGDLEFNDPRDLAVDEDGNLYVADTRNFRVQKLVPVQ